MIEHVEHEKLRVEAGQNQRQDHIACLLVTMAEKSKAESYSDAWNLDITKSHTTQQKKQLLRLQGVLLVPPLLPPPLSSMAPLDRSDLYNTLLRVPTS